MALNILDWKARGVIAASYALPDLETAVHQVAYNCIDAHAKQIKLLVNVSSASFTVWDDGDGIQPEDLYNYIGECHASSRFPISGGERKQHHVYASRGAFLNELVSLAETVEIESRVHEHWTSYRKVFKDGEPVFNARSKVLCEAPGTKVSVSNLFRKLPVRRKDLSRNSKYRLRVIQNIQNFCVSMSMIWPSLAFDVRFEGEEVRAVTIPAVRTCAERFFTHFGEILGHDLQYVTFSPDAFPFSIRGYFAFIPEGWEGLAQGIKQAKSYYQFAFLENEWVEACQNLCSRVITKAALNYFSAIPIFVLKVSSPRDQYDSCRAGTENRVVFKAPEKFNQFLIGFVQSLAAIDGEQTKVRQTSQSSQRPARPVSDLQGQPSSIAIHDPHLSVQNAYPSSSIVPDSESEGRSFLQDQVDGFDEHLSVHYSARANPINRGNTLPRTFEDDGDFGEQDPSGELSPGTTGMCRACGQFRQVVKRAAIEADSAEFQPEYEASYHSFGAHLAFEEPDVDDLVTQSFDRGDVDQAENDLEDIFFSCDPTLPVVTRARNSTSAQVGPKTPWLSSKPDASDSAEVWLNMYEDDVNRAAITDQPNGGLEVENDLGLYLPTAQQRCGADTSNFDDTKSNYFAVGGIDPSRTQFARRWVNTKSNPVKHLDAVLQIDNVRVLKGDRSIKISKATLAHMHVIRQVDRKFILVHADTSRGKLLLCIDQHAADERIRLEKLELEMFGIDGSLRRVEFHEHEPPLSLRLNFKERQVVNYHEQLVRSWGFDFEIVQSEQVFQYVHDATEAQEGQVLLHATPKVEKRVMTVDDFRDFIQLLSSAGKTYLHSQIRPPAITRLLHSRACRSAIMFGDWLSIGQCKELIEELKTCQLPFQCAHGRPSVVPLAEIHSSIM